jgi:hypothetical protein
MVNKKFESYKINREIKRSGISYTFMRPGKNGYGEPSDKLEDATNVVTFSGLYHEQNSHISVTTGSTIRYRSKKIPMILCEFENTTEIKVDDFVMINNNKYKVTGIVDIQNWNIISDISLEVEDNGN